MNAWLTSNHWLAAAICSKPQSQMARLLWSEFRAGAALTAAKQVVRSSLLSLWCSLKGMYHGSTCHFLIFLILSAREDVLHSQKCTYQHGESQAVYCFVPCAGKSNIWAPPGVGSTVQMGIRFNSWTSFLWILRILSHREVCLKRSRGVASVSFGDFAVGFCGSKAKHRNQTLSVSFLQARSLLTAWSVYRFHMMSVKPSQIQQDLLTSLTPPRLFSCLYIQFFFPMGFKERSKWILITCHAATGLELRLWVQHASQRAHTIVLSTLLIRPSHMIPS